MSYYDKHELPSGEHEAFFRVTYRQGGSVVRHYYAIQLQDTDTEASVYNELLNVGDIGGGWEWHGHKEISEKEYMRQREREASR